MAQQFIFPYQHNTYRKQQALPDVFTEYFHTGKTMLYLTGNDRNKYITEIKNINGKWMVGDSEWRSFVKNNVPSKTVTMHFIRQGEDDYYVTVYEENGSECPGYDRRTVGARLVRCLSEYADGTTLLPGDFLQDIWHSNFTIKFDGMLFNVRHRRIQPLANNRMRFNGFSGAGWNGFAERAGLEIAQKIVFTNFEQYELSVVVFRSDGLGIGREKICPTMPKKVGRKVPFEHEKDLRLQHACEWPFHQDHVNEERVFYTPLCAYVTDASKLTIKVDFCNEFLMHVYTKAFVVNRSVRAPMKVEMVFYRKKPTKTNHVTLKGNWRGFARACNFVQPKMMRFKLVRIDQEIKDGVRIQVPIFHVC